MKKILIVLVLLCATLAVSAQEVPSSFPRKFLIEHFTGDQCGYCPGGMFSLKEYVLRQTTPCIWVSHHYGYNKDEYTITESSKIGAACGVQGAPNMSFNRTKITGNTIAFHPGYLSEMGMDELIANKCENEAEASVKIDHSYDATTQQLNVTVSGLVSNNEVTEYLLSVLVKENGLVGKQADYSYSWKTAGYKEFLHPCVVRNMMTLALGDTVKVEKQRYSKSFSYTLPMNLVPENCCVVAYITPLNKKPIINAEETTLIAGSMDKYDFLPYGITEIQAPNNATNLTFSQASYNKPSDDKLQLTLVAKSATRSDAYGPVKMVANIEFNTTGETIPEGTYEINDTNAPNTVSIGTTDLRKGTFGGSLLTYVISASLETDKWGYTNFWRIKQGTMTVDANGTIVIEGKLFNTKNFKATYTPAQ